MRWLIACESITLPDTQRILALSAAALRPTSSTHDWSAGAQLLQYLGPSGPGSFVADVNLPDGAVITEVRVSIVDNHATLGLSATLHRKTFTATGIDALGTASSVGALPTPRELVITPTSTANVSNDIRAWALTVVVGGPDNLAQMLVLGAKVYYTIDTPLP